ncbi:MAG: pre-peptidase C-terminal domain-containing protein [Planctomycetaceae bacterium]|nr:pre-peptidase C-terminal domain-containing protein [Planctomycetaceae bacterium]
MGGGRSGKRFVGLGQFAACLLVAAVWSCLAAAAAHGEDAPSPDFNTHVAPLLQKYCAGCHNPDDKEGGLVLGDYQSLLAGGENGAVVVAGAADRSRLLLVLTGKADPKMPPEGNEGPTEAEVGVIQAWIAAGAKSPTGEAPDPTRLIVPKIAPRVARRAPVQSLAWSPDGKLVAVGTYREVRLVNPASRGTERKLEVPHGNVMDVAFSADGKRLAAAAGEPGLFGEVTVWDVAAGTVQLTFRAHQDSLFAVAWSPDGKLLATGSYDQLVQLWDAASAAPVRQLAGHSGAVFDLAFHPQGTMLASASADRTVKLWDVASGQRLDTFSQPLGEMYAVAFAPDGKRVAAGGVDNRIRVWQISDSGQEGTNPLLVSRFAHERPIIKLLYSPDGKSLVSAAEDRTIKLWTAATVDERLLLEQQSDWTPALGFAPDNKSLAVGRLDGSLAFYDAQAGKPTAPAKPELVASAPRGIQRGQAVRLELTGKNLLEVTGIETGSDQISARPVENPNEDSGRLVVEITAAATLARGEQRLAVVTAGGTSNKLKFYVDDLPQIVEVEPNDAPAIAAHLAIPATYWGTIAQMGDVDYISFDANAGETIVCEASSRGIGGKANIVLTLTDAGNRVVASNNDYEGEEDPLLAYRVPQPGRYTLQINDLAQAGSPEHFYRLSVGAFPYVTGVFPLSVAANSESTVRLAGYNLPPDSTVKLAAAPAGEIAVPVDPATYRTRRPLKVVVGTMAEIIEVEPNGTPEQATRVSAPVTIGGRIFDSQADAATAAADVDLYRFDAQAGQEWIIETEAEKRGSPLDTKIDILDAGGKPIERVLLQATRNSAINFRPINSSQTEIRVDNWEEMELNEYMYLQGEVCKIFRLPQGPDSGFQFYGSNGMRHCYFDTSGTNHAVAEQCFIVEPRTPGTSLLPNGLPVFPLYYSNDDDGRRRLGRDSRVRFTAPAAGSYLVRVVDVRGAGGDRYAYRLTIRPPAPDFAVSIQGANPEIRTDGGRNLTFAAERIDDFDGPIRIDVAGLPPGYVISTPVTIEAGQAEASAVIYAQPDAKTPPDEAAAGIKAVATAEINGAPMTREAGSIGKIKLIGQEKVTVRLEPAEVTIRPGETATLQLKIERHNHDARVSFKFENLPHGVIVDNIGLNGILIPEGQSERQVILSARPWVAETSRSFHAVAVDAGNEASLTVTLHVRKTPTVAKAFGK